MTDKLSERMRNKPWLESKVSHEWADEVAALEQRVEEYQRDDEVWDKHSLVEIVEERNALKQRVERLGRRENGEEFCEAHEDWLPIEEMQMDSEGVWLCQEAWDELVADTIAQEKA